MHMCLTSGTHLFDFRPSRVSLLLVPRQMYERTQTGLAPEIVHFNMDTLGAEGEEDMILKR